MRKRWSALPGLCIAVFLLVSLPACGHKQQLESITIIPAVENFGATNIPVTRECRRASAAQGIGIL